MGIDAKRCPSDLLDAAKSAWDRAVQGEEYGYRNAQTTVIAPTGTIGLVMAADTTGVEPQFSLVQYKQLAGGGTLRIINRGVPSALKRLGYTDSEVTSIVDPIMGTGRLSGSPGLDPRILKEKGFTDEVLSNIESSMPDVFDIRSAFSPSVLGR